MSKNKSKTKAELEAELAALRKEVSARSKQEAPAADAIEQLLEQNRRLAAALQDSRREAEAARSSVGNPTGEAFHAVKNEADRGVIVDVTDAFGRSKRIRFDRRGATHQLTAGQIEEIRINSAWLFDQGYLSVPGYMPSNPNVTGDPAGFVASMKMDEIASRVADIGSKAALQAIYNHLESLRFEVVVGKEGDTLKELPLTPTQKVLHDEVRRRLIALSGLNVSADSAA
jgi:hypothetical protein